MTDNKNKPASPEPEKDGESTDQRAVAKPEAKKPSEVGGPAGLDPTRYGDWERKGILSDF